MYITLGHIRHTEQDIFTEGCDPSTSNSQWIDMVIKRETKEELVSYLKEYCSATQEDLQLNACDENSRLDIQVMEDEEGLKASKTELALWKDNKKKLFLSTYTFKIYKLDEVTL